MGQDYNSQGDKVPWVYDRIAVFHEEGRDKKCKGAHMDKGAKHFAEHAQLVFCNVKVLMSGDHGVNYDTER